MKAIKNTSKEIIDIVKPNENDFFEDIDFNIPDNVETIHILDNTEKIDIPDNTETIDVPKNIETINFANDIKIPSDDGLANDAPKKIKIINKPDSLNIASNKVMKKYIRQKSKDY